MIAAQNERLFRLIASTSDAINSNFCKNQFQSSNPKWIKKKGLPYSDNSYKSASCISCSKTCVPRPLPRYAATGWPSGLWEKLQTFAHALSSYDDSRTLLMATSNVQGVREALLNHQGRLSLAGRSFACPQNAICWRFSPNQKHTQRLERCLLLEVCRRQVRSETFMSFIWRKPARFECLCSSFWSELSLQTQVGEWFLRCITFALDLKVCP